MEPYYASAWLVSDSCLLSRLPVIVSVGKNGGMSIVFYGNEDFKGYSPCKVPKGHHLEGVTRMNLPRT